ncbi:hypothetical protein HWV62_21122 [Athelia sp. TMB]|nr:hypothetical protein HWV62_21122 [Athelia sp. TMB]
MTYKRRISLTAILYLHRITDNRMTSNVIANTDMLQRLCGNAALSNIILVTTMWDSVDQKTGERREKQLQDIFWRSMVGHGSQNARFSLTSESAWDILGPFTGHFFPATLQIQTGTMAAEIPLFKCSFGSFLKSWLAVLSKQFNSILAWFRKAPRTSTVQSINDGRVVALGRGKTISFTRHDPIHSTRLKELPASRQSAGGRIHLATRVSSQAKPISRDLQVDYPQKIHVPSLNVENEMDHPIAGSEKQGRYKPELWLSSLEDIDWDLESESIPHVRPEPHNLGLGLQSTTNG